ncbi:hypothetical protein ABID16_000585 [Rhizobium aquaticum]|uniref:Uncharacterized protein n=1 Tax=Rhizobium aquaticum TaxID=1549636 RepID=A0ABV2IUW4_9HYPH
MTSSMPDQVEIQSTDITVDPAAYTSEGPGAFFEMGTDAVASRAGGSKFLAFRQFPAHQGQHQQALCSDSVDNSVTIP